MTCITVHHAKFDVDPTTWVVWANSQFATVSGVFISFFLPSVLFLFASARLQIAPGVGRVNRHRSTLSRRVLRQGCAFWGVRIFNFHIFAHFTKNLKIKPEIGNFKPKC